MALVDELAFNRMVDSEYNWVISGWLRSYRDWWDRYAVEKGYLPDEYDDVVRPVVERILEQNPPLVAVLRDIPMQCIGWICGGEGELDYVYVKGPFRHNGVATRLIREHCGEAPGIFHWASDKRYFTRSLRRKGWRYEAKDETFRKELQEAS